jgi:Zn-dependent protease
MAAGGLRIGTFAGAPVIMDWSVAILAGYVVFSRLAAGGAGALPGALVLLAAIFVSILIHEFSHAAMAAAFKLPSKAIMLTFFGGHVEFERKPEKRWHDFVVSAAGPLSNLALAGLLFGLGAVTPQPTGGLGADFLNQLFVLNLLLGAFNLLPGFPLDGGRMLSSALSYVMSPPRARIVAGVTGIGIAALAAWYGLAQGLPWTMLIGLLLVLAALAEIAAARRVLRGET